MIKLRRPVRVISHLLVSVFLVFAPVLGVALPAHAADPCAPNAAAGNYRYWCYNGTGSSPTNFSTWCQPSGCTGSGGSLSGWSSPEYGYGYRNCTDYVAWKLNQVGTPIGGGWGNGNQWADHATGVYAVDSQPAVGAVAQWNSGPFGHVAYVEAYNSSTHIVSVSEYNYDLDGNYRNDRQFNIDNTNNGKPDNYIHIERGTLATAPSGWWLDPPTPKDGTSSLTNNLALPISVHGVDNSGSGLRQIDITWQMGSGAQWQKSTKSIFSSTTFQSDYTYYLPAPVGGWPSEVVVSFDVYSMDGKIREAPQGMRRICRSGLACTPITVPGQQGGGSGGAPTSGCTPGQYQAAVFTDPNYGGSCVLKGIGEYSNPESIGLPNDSISSIKVGSGSSVRLCDNAGLNSPCEFFTGDDPDLYNNMINTNTVSSMKVEGGAPTTNCQPAENQVAFFMNPNYDGTCIIKGVGRYDDPAAINLPNDTISSLKVGNRVKVRVCDNAGNNSPCEIFENNDDNLYNNMINTDTISSAEVTSRGGIALCDNTNYGGECKYYGAGNTGESLYNLSDQGFDNRVESVRYDPDWAGQYHIVLYTDQNQSGYLYHADNSSPDLQNPYNNNISSVKIYKNQPPGAVLNTPLNAVVYPMYQHNVMLDFDGGDQRRVHVWGTNGFDQSQDWSTSKTMQLSSLTPGTYSWQVQAKNNIGEGAWTTIRTFSVDTPPTVIGGTLTIDAGTTQTIQVQAIDPEHPAVALSASNLPSFATFTDNHNNTATLTFSPSTAQAGNYAVTIAANDGMPGGTGTGMVNLQVASVGPQIPAGGYLAEYFNNLTLAGTPILSRGEAAVDNDWGNGGPGSPVGVDNFSARWTKTADFAAGNYNFSVTADDGVRLYIDDVLAIDKWIDQGATTYTANKTLTAGSHTIKMEYYESGGGAVAKLAYQQVTVLPPAPGVTSGTTYKLINPNSGKALDVSGGVAADGTNVQIWTDTGASAQKWRITQNADGSYKLLNPSTNRALDVNGGGTSDGTNVQIWTDTGASAQKWAITQNSDGTYKLMNPSSGKTLDIDGGNTADGTNVQIWTDNNSAAQKWQIVDATVATTPPVVRATSSGNTSGASMSLSKPGGTVNGDLLILTASADLDVNENVTYTVASGWQPLLPLTRSDAASGGTSMQVWYKIANAEPSSYTVAQDHANLMAVSIQRINGHDATNPIDVSSMTKSLTGEALGPSITTTAPNDLVMRRVSWDQSRTIVSDPAGITRSYYVHPSGHDAWGGYKTQPTAGSTGVAQFDLSGGSPYIGFTFAIRPAGAPTPPAGGTELLTSAWNITGNNGASEKYQTIPSNALAGKTTVRVTYDLHGLQAMGGDASALVFDQNGWKYVSLSNYGQNGLNGSQTVDIPISAFGLDTSQPVGTLHTRFWYGGAFGVDITSVKVL